MELVFIVKFNALEVDRIFCMVPVNNGVISLVPMGELEKGPKELKGFAVPQKEQQ